MCGVSETPVEFIRHLENQTVTEIPGVVTFECELSKPNIKVQWQRGDQPLLSSDKYNIQMEATVHRLIIREVDGQDVSEYTALARGKTSKAALLVQGIPLKL